MIGTSFGEWLIIRFWVAFFRYTPLFYLAFLSVIYTFYGISASHLGVVKALYGLLAAEAIFYGFIYFPYTQRLYMKAIHPPPLSSPERKALFDQCMNNVHNMEHYLRWWFQGAEIEEIRRDNLREFLLWGFFDPDQDANGEPCSEVLEQEMAGFVARIEQGLGRVLLSGRGNARCIRMTLDDIETTYRSFLWYATMFAVDQVAHWALLWYGFELYARPPAAAMKTFPPRPQELFTKQRSQASELSYYYRPHLLNDSFPLVFIHGIGIGLWTYVRFLADIHATGKRGRVGGVGIIAIEILPVSFRLTSPPLGKEEFLRQMTKIIDHHGWNNFAVVSHSYGSVPTTHMIQCPTLRHKIMSVVLIDPVTIMLHHPDVAYNFTRRRPKKANEWQLWYFASTDPGVAHCLGRHFFWQENIVWKEELLLCDRNQRDGPMMGRRVAVCLAGRDILVDTPTVAKYLTDQMAPYCDGVGSGQEVGVKVIMFPKLDHAQVFDSPSDCEKVVRLIQLYCRNR